jgi:hypothetical protein
MVRQTHVIVDLYQLPARAIALFSENPHFLTTLVETVHQRRNFLPAFKATLRRLSVDRCPASTFTDKSFLIWRPRGDLAAFPIRQRCHRGAISVALERSNRSTPTA